MTYITPPISPCPSQPFNPLLLQLFFYLTRRHGASPSVAGISAFNFHRKIRGVIIIVNHHLFLVNVSPAFNTSMDILSLCGRLEGKELLGSRVDRSIRLDNDTYIPV